MGLCMTLSQAAVMNFGISPSPHLSTPSAAHAYDSRAEERERRNSGGVDRHHNDTHLIPHPSTSYVSHSRSLHHREQHHTTQSLSPRASLSHGTTSPPAPLRQSSDGTESNVFQSHRHPSEAKQPQSSRTRRSSVHSMNGGAKKRGTGAWTEAEDAMLFELVRAFGTKNWVSVERAMEGRDKKQCRERWCNHVNPHINDAPFSEAESVFIIDCYVRHGRQWARMSRCPELQNRPDNAIKNHFNTNLRDHYAELCRQYNIPRRQPNDLQELDKNLYEQIRGKITAPPTSSMRGSKTSRFVSANGTRTDVTAQSLSPPRQPEASSLQLIASPHSSSSSSLDPQPYLAEEPLPMHRRRTSPHEHATSHAVYHRQILPASDVGVAWSQSGVSGGGGSSIRVRESTPPTFRQSTSSVDFDTSSRAAPNPASLSGLNDGRHPRSADARDWGGHQMDERQYWEFGHRNVPDMRAARHTNHQTLLPQQHEQEHAETRRGLQAVSPLVQLPPLPTPHRQAQTLSQPTTPSEDAQGNSRSRSQSELDSEHKSLLWSNMANFRAARRTPLLRSTSDRAPPPPSLPNIAHSTASARFNPYFRPPEHAGSGWRSEVGTAQSEHLHDARTAGSYAAGMPVTTFRPPSSPVSHVSAQSTYLHAQPYEPHHRSKRM